MKKMLHNTAMLYLMNAAKLIFPLLTLPYLTRVLTVDTYATVAYVKSVMAYAQLLVDFGFMLSATKEIVNAGNDKKTINQILANTLLAKLILTVGAFGILLVAAVTIPLLRANALYTLLSFVVIFQSCFLMDYLFRGIERMGIITVRFVTMKGISTILTLVFVHQDGDILWIPVLDMIGSLVAIALVVRSVKKLGFEIQLGNLKSAIYKLKISATYFLSDMATTAFGALNTLLIGIFIQAKEVAYWSITLQIISAVQVMYTPIMQGIYPEMVRRKNLHLIKKILVFFMPLIILGCGILYCLSGLALLIVGGEKYLVAVPVLRALIPVLFFSFPGMLLGWPTLGAIGRVKETSSTTIITALVQTLGLAVLIITNHFTLLSVAFLRGATEGLMCLLRLVACWNFRKEFNEGVV